jgi:hypothetical protein
MDALVSQATQNTDAEAAAVNLFNSLAGMVQTSAGDKAAALDLATKLKASADALGAAIVANTPAA